jgi:Protein of unknown function (DUF1499)
MRSQLLCARLALAALMLALLAATAAIGTVRLGTLPFDSGLAIMAGAAALAMIALLLALVWLFRALNSNQGAGKRAGLVALFGSLALLWPPLHSWTMGLTSPAIHDATTNPEDPPQFVALAKRAPGMSPAAYDGNVQIRFHGETNTANYMLHTYYADLTHPKGRLLWTKSKLFWHSFETAKAMGWHIVDYSEQQGRIEATDTSFWFGQKADIVIRVREAGPLGAIADLRSQSETGRQDLGANIARLKAYLKAA